MTVLRNTKPFFICATFVVFSAGGTLGQPMLSHVLLALTCRAAVAGPHRSHCQPTPESPGSLTTSLHDSKGSFSNMKVLWFCSDTFNEKCAWLKYPHL